eukprot:SAG11_NODE_18882_length_479_cov_0.934211_1_plen_115_part_10
MERAFVRQRLHELGLRDANFDPSTASAYARSGLWVDAIVAALLLLALLEQMRCACGFVADGASLSCCSKHKADADGGVLSRHSADTSPWLALSPAVTRRRRRQAVLFLGGWLYLV